MTYQIIFKPEGTRIKIDASQSILYAAVSGGVHINAACNGMGECGKCKIVVERGDVETKETTLLTRKEVEQGYYIACQTYAKSDLEVLIPPESRLGEHQILEHLDIIGRQKKKVTSENLGLAVDIGTTTVVVYLVDLDSGKYNIVDIRSKHNKQAVYGADVLARINYSKDTGGLSKLHQLIVETINESIEILMERNFLSDSKKHKITRIVTSGNTTMTYLLLKKDPEVIQKNVQINDFRTPVTITAKEVGIQCGNPDAEIYCVPGIANYVGGDIVSDILASGMHTKDEISMLIDVGTNGEVAMGNKDWIVTCSTSAGPAFEGGETKHGMKASTGAIEKFKIEDIEVSYAVINNDRPRGICGSGLIDILSELFLSGVLDYKGRIRKVGSKLDKRIRPGEMGAEFVVVRANETATGKDIVITEKDVKNIIMTKAAIYAGASTLTKVGMGFEDISRIYIAGGFGNFLDVRKAIVLGLLPDQPIEKFEFIGNGSAKGAYLILTDENMKKEAEEIAKKATYMDLSKGRDFTEEYMKAIFIPHQNPDIFPSVEV